MKKILALFLSVILMSGAQQIFAAAGDVRLDPAKPTVATSTNFTLAVVVDSGASKVGSYDFSLSFDPTKLQVDTTQCGGKGVCNGSDGFSPTVNTDNAKGTINANGFTADAVGPGAALQMLVIQFVTQTVAGSATVSFSKAELYDAVGDAFPTVTPSGSTVTITGAPAQVTVPDVSSSNPTQAAAEAAIKAAGLTPTVTTAPSATVPAGSVISQDPLAGTNVAAGTAVKLVVSSGPPPVGGAPIPTLSEWALLLLSLLLGGVLWRTHARRANFHA